MNPLTNRWAALIVVAVLLLGVSELVGTSDNGGILSQFAASRAAEETETPPAVAVADTGPAPVVEESDPEVEEDEDGSGDVDVDVEDDPFAAVDEPEPELVEDDEPPVAGTSIVSRQPPGPPGVFTEQ